MMARKRLEKPGYGKLLDAWQAPHAKAGEPVGCLATTFTFKPDFFEEECLSRFVGMQTNAHENQRVYLIEREERLSKLDCATVLVDQHHCHGVRCMRWDMLPIRPRRGILHAKIALLYWAQHIRLLVSSANLTTDGYRRNREVFGILNFHREGEVPLECLEEVVDFLREVVSETANPQAARDSQQAGPVSRAKGFLDRLIGEGRGMMQGSEAGRGPVRIYPILTGPNRPSVFESVDRHWPGRTGPERADVVSPFFDSPDRVNRPAAALRRLLRPGGDSEVCYHVTADREGDDVIHLHAPESLCKTGGEDAGTTCFHIIADEHEEGRHRPLHAKSIWLKDGKHAAYMIGSSNFTSAGTGLAEPAHFEANLLYVCDGGHDECVAAYNRLSAARIEGEEPPLDARLSWRPAIPEDEHEAEQQLLLLPDAFGEAVFCRSDDHKGRLRLHIDGQPPGGFRVTLGQDPPPLLDEAGWEAQGRPSKVEVPWAEAPPPAGLEVTWAAGNGPAWWPVNIENAQSLPPPEELKALPLEDLIRYFTTGKLPSRKQRRTRSPRDPDGGSTVSPNPHDRVDTRAFLLQRTRRLSWAFNALVERLKGPFATENELRWWVDGPLGVRAVVAAIEREARSEAEQAFLLTELALEISGIEPNYKEGHVDTIKVREALRGLVDQLHQHIAQIQSGVPETVKCYIRNVFEEAVP